LIFHGIAAYSGKEGKNREQEVVNTELDSNDKDGTKPKEAKISVCADYRVENVDWVQANEFARLESENDPSFIHLFF
jgi:hypothetical protein